MTEPLSIDYKLGHHGWSSFRLAVGETSTEVGEFGYCTDALGDLVRAALIVATSGDRAEVSFDGEPWEWRLIVDKDWKAPTPPREFRVRILVFPDISARSSEADGQIVFEALCAADAFARAVQTSAQVIWDEYGADGYNKAWLPLRNGFPLRALQALKAALLTEEPSLPSRT